jgi:Fur family transcriptional regulator, ferric uptake regulator
MNKMLELLSESLKSNGHSLTKTREKVFLALLDREPQTMADLANSVGGKVDRASVYRTIALFEKLGITERLQIGWKYKIELSDTFAAHHHHITCTNCNKTQVFEETSILEFELKQIAQEAGYTEVGHQLEIRGLCTSCQHKVIK